MVRLRQRITEEDITILEDAIAWANEISEISVSICFMATVRCGWRAQEALLAQSERSPGLCLHSLIAKRYLTLVLARADFAFVTFVVNLLAG